MSKKCLPILIVLIISLLHAGAQNVFSPTDSVYTYNAAAPAGSPSNPNIPPANTMAKWIRTTTRIGWYTNNFKAYIWNGLQFRLRFPVNYNPALKYPVMVFLHGGGEAKGIYDNEDQLFWGAQSFEERMTYGYWNGFLLFPQIANTYWETTDLVKINSVIDTLAKYNGGDADRMVTLGLSAGGYGAVKYASDFPQRVAATAPASPSFVRNFLFNANDYKHVPIWITHGGTDPNPISYDANYFCDSLKALGGNVYQQFLGTQNHFTWYYQWNHLDINNQYILNYFWMNAHKAQPLLFFGRNEFCPGAPINAKMGITAGFNAYEWQRDAGAGFTNIAGATSNEYTATQTGTYRVRFRRTATGAWSDWSPRPITVSVRPFCSPDTIFAQHFDSVPINYSASPPYTKAQLYCINGFVPNATELFSQDAVGKQGGGFLANYTDSLNGFGFTNDGFTYAVGDTVYRTNTTINVTPNTNYVFSFYLGNLSTTNRAQIVPIINTTVLTPFVQANGEGNPSWTKFSFNWNSGAATTATITLRNLTGTRVGNDFVIDEIALVRLAGSLPLQLIDFNVTKQNETALLKWVTTNETNTSHFEAEHSIDGANWTSIGAIRSRNTAGNNNYSFTHTNPVKSINYYRLKQVDADGRYQYLPVRRVIFGKNASLLVYPNPATDKVSIQSNEALRAINVFSTSGQLVIQQTISNGAAGRVNDVNITTLRKGMYILQLVNMDGVVENLKLIKE